jgi:hypothetical protein
MRPTRSVVGWGLILFSLISVIQTARAIWLWESASRCCTERSVQSAPITFAGSTIEVSDNLPRTATGSQSASQGEIQLRIDGQPVGVPSRAAVRSGLTDLGRYHGWLDAWVFTDRGSDSSLWITRRLQPAANDPVRFELVIVRSNGAVERRTVHGWQLAFDFPSFRSTQFIRSEWEVLPLDVSEVAGFFPIFLLLFPLGTLVAGIVLLVRSRLRAPAI